MSRVTSLLLALFLCGDATADEDVIDVTMVTGMGEIRIELYASKAPLTVANFLELTDGGHLDVGSFYRVVNFENDSGNPKIEVVQGGLGDARSPLAPIAHESTELTGILHKDGVISMARGAVGTASAEFFICIGDQPGLDFGQPRHADRQGFAAFGKVVAGMDVVARINAAPAEGPSESAYTRGQILTEPVQIVSVRRSIQSGSNRN